MLGCLIGAGEIAALIKMTTLPAKLQVIFEAVANAVGRLPNTAKLTIEGLFAVLKGYVGLLAKGTKAVVEVINRVMEALLKWVLGVGGKIVREAYILTLRSGKTLTCTIIPVEYLGILLSKAVSAALKKKFATFNLRFFEKEGIYYVEHKGKIIFGGDKTEASKFIDEIENKADDEVQKILDDLYNGKRIYRLANSEDEEIIKRLRGKYKSGRKRNIAYAKGDVGGKKIDLESISGGEKTSWKEKGNFEPPEPVSYQYKNGPEPLKERHTEQKIVEHLRLLLKNNKDVTGEIELISERIYCRNCRWIVDQFQKEFPNIKIIRVYIKNRS